MVIPIVVLAVMTVAIGLLPQPLLAVADRAAAELLDPAAYSTVLGIPEVTP